MEVKHRRRAQTPSPLLFPRRIAVALLLLSSAAAAKAAWKAGEPIVRKAPAPAPRSRYVAIQHPADADLRRRAAELARRLNLPLLAEHGVKGIVIKEFRP